MADAAFQDFYPDDWALCYGCGRLNEHGLHIRSVWDGDETVARFTPQPYHTAIPGYVYGGLIASLIDCHGTGTAAGAGYRAEGREPGSEPPLRYVTASLKVDYLRPTPLGPELEIRGRVRGEGAQGRRRGVADGERRGVRSRRGDRRAAAGEVGMSVGCFLDKSQAPSRGATGRPRTGFSALGAFDAVHRGDLRDLA